MSIYRVFPIPWEGRLEIYTRAGTPRVCTRSFRFKYRDLYTEQTEASSKCRNSEGILIGSQTTQRLLVCGFLLGSFSPWIRGRKDLCVPAEEGGSQHHGTWTLDLATWLTWLRRQGGEILSNLRVFKRNFIFLPGQGRAEELRSLPCARTHSSQPNKQKNHKNCMFSVNTCK